MKCFFLERNKIVLISGYQGMENEVFRVARNSLCPTLYFRRRQLYCPDRDWRSPSPFRCPWALFPFAFVLIPHCYFNSVSSFQINSNFSLQVFYFGFYVDWIRADFWISMLLLKGERDHLRGVGGWHCRNALKERYRFVSNSRLLSSIRVGASAVAPTFLVSISLPK